MKRKYHVVEAGSKGAAQTIQAFRQSNGQMLLPLLDLIQQARLAVGEVIDQAGRGLIETILTLSAEQAPAQRCQKHAKANARRRVRKREREEFSKDLSKIFYAPQESQARAALHELKAKWAQSFPGAVAVVEKDFDALLRFFQFDPTYWTVLRTANPRESGHWYICQCPSCIFSTKC